jgi:hypothetical protein
MQPSPIAPTSGPPRPNRRRAIAISAPFVARGKHSAILRPVDDDADRARRFDRGSRRRKRYRLIVNVVHLNWRPFSVASQPSRKNM